MMVPPMDESPPRITRDLQDLIGALTPATSPAEVQVQLEAIGIHATTTLADTFRKSVLRLGGSPDSPEHLALLMLEMLQSPQPSEALINLLRFLDHSASPQTFLNTIASSKAFREILATVFGTSRYMADIIVRNPGYLYWLIERQTWERIDTKESLLVELRRDAGLFHTVETKLNAVRRLQRRSLLKIGVQDLLGARSIEETTLALSHLADALAQAVMEILWGDIFGEHAPAASEPNAKPGEAPGEEASRAATPSGFAVLALGKLGGAELNYSSDIDLIYMCEDCDDARLDQYTQLAKRLTGALSEVTTEGYLYRVDLRLRPDGKAGPIVSPKSAMIVYYESRGRPWEFQAMLKARVIAGDDALGQDFLRQIGGLTFSPSPSYSPIESIAAMRSEIRNNISSRDRAYNIKLMEGGIRDIEFIVQSLQLKYGRAHRVLRVPGTLEGIHLLYQQQLIDDLEHNTLADAYRFLRLVEHRLQMMHQLQTHSIPQSLDEVSILARRVSKGPLGRFGYDDFLSMLTTHLNKIRVISDSFFAERELPESSLLLLLPEDHERAQEILGRYGHADIKKSLGLIQALAYGTFPQLLDRGAREAFQKLLPDLLTALSETPDPSASLVRFARMVEHVPDRAGLYTHLAESEPLRGVARDIAGASPVLSALVARQPDFLGSLPEVAARTLREPIQGIRWNALAGSLEEQHQTTDRIRRAMDRRLLSAWVIDVDGATLPQVLSQTVTESTREVVSAVFERAFEDQSGVALMALGSFGVGEPRPGSDVDLLVVSQEREMEPVTRAAQQLNRMLTETKLLKLDFRLRGEGASAPLVQDIESYERYFTTRMSHWERVAFAKCAFWCGDPAVAKTFIDTLMPELTRVPDTDMVTTLVDTRAKLAGLVSEGARPIETKRSAGGRYDIEYMCALGNARAGEPYPLDLSTPGRVDRLAEAAFITEKEGAMLKEALTLFARIECLIELSGEPLPSSEARTTEMASEIEKILALLGMPVRGSLLDALARRKADVRASYDRFIAQLSE